MWYTWEEREIHTGFCFKNLKERFCLEDMGMDEWIILSVFSINAVGGMDSICLGQDRYQ